MNPEEVAHTKEATAAEREIPVHMKATPHLTQEAKARQRDLPQVHHRLQVEVHPGHHPPLPAVAGPVTEDNLNKENDEKVHITGGNSLL